MRMYKSGSMFALWRWTFVTPEGDGEPYLIRLHLVATPLFSIMLHWINRPDPQPDMHDHPVSFISFLLRGWYIEVTPTGPRVIQRVNFKRALDAHRIIGGRALTLVFASRRLRNWGFHTPAGWVYWRDYSYKETRT